MNSGVPADNDYQRTTLRSILKLWLVFLPVAVAFAALTAGQSWLYERNMARHDTIWINFLAYLVLVAYWLAIAPIVAYVIRSFPLASGVYARHISIHVITICSLGAGYMLYLWAANMYVIRFLGPDKFAYIPLHDWLHESGTMAVSNAIFRYYIPVAAIGYVGFYRDLSRKRALRAVNLENELGKAKLQMLRIRLQPHFLFNTLNSISELMHTDIKEADRMLVLLGELLRIILQNAEGDEYVPLHVELNHLNKYLEIEKVRFRERLAVRYEIAPECLEMQVPYLLLQPVAENAVKHGASKRSSGGLVVVKASCSQQEMILTIEDNGPGLGKGEGSGAGLGMGVRHTRTRLRELYGADGEIRIKNTRQGVRVVISIPKKSAGMPVAGSGQEL